MTPLRVLCVDDDETQLAMVKAWLESAGHTPVTHVGPAGATRRLVKENPDVVLLDIVMPGLTGDALVLLLGRVAASVRLGVIFYSAHPSPRLPDGGALRILGLIPKTGRRTAFLDGFHALVSQVTQ